MSKPYSICSLVRKTIGLKGSTEHSGRGFYMMDFEGSHMDFLNALERARTVWAKRGLTPAVRWDQQEYPNGHGVAVTFSFPQETTADGYYRHLRVSMWTNLHGHQVLSVAVGM